MKYELSAKHIQFIESVLNSAGRKVAAIEIANGEISVREVSVKRLK